MSASETLREFIPPPDHTGEEAVLHISNWYSWCGACKRHCDPEHLTHERVLGYGPQGPGCHATFTSVASDYSDVAACRRMRPDLPLAAEPLLPSVEPAAGHQEHSE